MEIEESNEIVIKVLYEKMLYCCYSYTNKTMLFSIYDYMDVRIFFEFFHFIFNCIYVFYFQN